MSETILGVDFDIHGGGIDLVFPHHENECAQTYAGRGEPLARLWMHNGMVRFTGEKMSQVAGQHLAAARGARRVPGLDFDHVLRQRALPRADRVHAGHAGAGDANVERLREIAARRRLRRAMGWIPLWKRLWSGFYDALADDFNTPAATGALFEWVRDANRRFDAGESVAGRRRAARGADRDRPGDRVRVRRREADSAALELLEQRQAARAAKDFDEGRPPARRAARPRLGDPRHRRRSAAAPGLSRGPTPMILYGRNPVREALRGPRTVSPHLGDRAAAREDWLRELGRGIADRPRRRPTSSSRSPAPRDHQGVCAEVSDFQYADPNALLRPEDALVLVLDEIQDPHNLGALARVAESAGATGMVIAERRSAEVTPTVCKSSAGAVEHLPIARVGNISDYSDQGQGRGRLGLRRRRRRRLRATTSPTTRARS